MRLAVVRLGALSVVGMLLVTSGCVESESTTCGDTLCGPGLECDELHEQCVSPSQLLDCVGVQDGEACTVLGESGFHCDQEVCIPGICGDEVIDVGEACDYGVYNSDTQAGACRTTCLAPACGDGVLDDGDGEACDDGDDTDWDGCTDCAITEFQVDQGGGDTPDRVSVAVADDGRFVVVWAAQNQDGDNWGVFARHFAATGTPTGAPFQVNTEFVDGQYVPVVAMAGDGRFVVAWQSMGQDGDGQGVYAQRYDANGSAAGAELQVNTTTASHQASPRIAMADDGTWVVIWTSRDQDGDGAGVYGQRFHATGGAAGTEFRVNEVTASDQTAGAVAMAPDGRFVAAYTDGDQLGTEKTVYARLYDAAGTAAGAPFQVNTYDSGLQGAYGAAMGSDGRSVVLWVSIDQDGDGGGIYGQRFSATGAPEGSEFRVNTTITGDQAWPRVALAGDGTFVAVWESDGQDGSDRGIYGQRFSATGAPEGAELLLPIYTEGPQTIPAVDVRPDGRFVVAWACSDSALPGIFAQRYDAQGNALGVDP